jgi:nucleotide-binding universal stress UspA family protein
MAEEKDYLGEKLRLAERAREDAYFRTLDQALIVQMRQQAHADAEDAAQVQQLFTSILVPVDFSAYSAVALRYAAGIADRFTASVIILHVIARETTTHAVHQRIGPQRMTIPDPLISTYAPALPSDIEAVISDLREQAYTALQACVPAQLAKHPVELRVVVGHPFERILETAVREKVALIVLGTHGRTGLLHAIMGSVAERVVRLAPCPVLTVKTATVEEQGWLQSVYEKFITQEST